MKTLKFPLFLGLILLVASFSIASCSSSSDDSEPPVDTTDDTSDPTDDTTEETETVSFLKSMERQNPDGSLIRRVELDYNAANEVISRTITTASGSSNTISVEYEDGKLARLFSIEAATGNELLSDEFLYDSQGRLVLWASYVFDNVISIYAYEYDSQDRLLKAIFYQDQDAYDNDQSLTRNDLTYQGSEQTFYERTSVTTIGGTENVVYKERNTQISSQSSSMNIGEGGANAPLNILLLTLIREDFYTFPNYLLETYEVDLVTDEIAGLASEVIPTFDSQDRITSAEVRYYNSETGALVSDEVYIWTYQDR